MLQNKNGYSLLELAIVISLMATVISAVILMVSYVTNTISNIFINNEAYMNGKLSVEFINSEIERYSYIDIYTYEDSDTIEKIIIFKDEYKLLKEANVIYFYIEGNGNRSNCIYFGGYNNGIMYTNKFSSYIESLEVKRNNEVVSINIKTMDNIKDNSAKSYDFTAKISIKNKKINFY